MSQQRSAAGGQLSNSLGNRKIDARGFDVPGQSPAPAKFTFNRSHFLLLLAAVIGLAFVIFTSLAKSVEVKAVSAVLAEDDVFAPLSATQEFNTWLKLPLGNRVLMLAGEHTVSLSAPGYQPLEQTLKIGNERNQQYELVMIREPGKLKIEFAPAIETGSELSGELGAMVSIDQGPSVLVSEALTIPAGKHELVIDAPLHRPVTAAVIIRGEGQTQTLSVSPEPAWAEYSFATEPIANVFIDEQKVGSTPLSIKLEEGLRSIAFEADGFKPFKQEIAVLAQQNLVIPSIALIPSDGELELASSPSEAAVIVNGQYRGITPLSIALAPDVAQRVQVYKAGYQLSEQELSLAPAQSEQQTIALQQDLVDVRLSVTPSDAIVYVDGVRQGQGSQTLRVNTLPHKISVRKAGYVPFNTELIPTKRNQQIVSVKLLTQDQHYWASVPSTYANQFGHKMKLFRPSGEFKMGSSRREAGRRANEAQYSVRLSKPFYVSDLETTNRQFRVFRAGHTSGNYKKKSLDANKAPVANVSWQDAARYCNWLSKQEGLDPFYKTRKGFISGINANANGYRLLTEAEWAWLAKVKDKEILTYPWGKDPQPPKKSKPENVADERASELIAFTLDNYNDGFVASAPVGRFQKNHNGLFDMGGNVSEWVNDWYSAKGSKQSASIGALVDPVGPTIGEFHVVRGASWAKGHLPQLRLAYRDYAAKGKHDVGFRVARYAGRTKSNSAQAGGS